MDFRPKSGCRIWVRVRPVSSGKIIWHFHTFCNTIICGRISGPTVPQARNQPAGLLLQNFSAPAAGFVFSKLFGACGGLCFFSFFFGACGGLCFLFISAPAAGFVFFNSCWRLRRALSFFSKFVGACGGLCFFLCFSAPAAGFA